VRSQVTGNLGEGVFVADRTHSVIAHNRIIGNAGTTDPAIGQPAQFCLGGPALLDTGPLTGGTAPAGDAVTHNLITGNHPFDVFSDGSGTHNQFSGNLCGTSTMPGICGGG
jgi:hypothetical protein